MSINIHEIPIWVKNPFDKILPKGFELRRETMHPLSHRLVLLDTATDYCVPVYIDSEPSETLIRTMIHSLVKRIEGNVKQA